LIREKKDAILDGKSQEGVRIVVVTSSNRGAESADGKMPRREYEERMTKISSESLKVLANLTRYYERNYKND
jgi:hypothetical protein